jgi:hypothetical protein
MPEAEVKEVMKYVDHGRWCVRDRITCPDPVPFEEYMRIMRAQGWCLTISTETRKRVFRLTFVREVPVTSGEPVG